VSGPRISSFCSGADCVQVERIGDVIAVRHTADTRRQLLFSLREWTAFLDGVNAGDFDDLVEDYVNGGR
jgi:hypothetical protein